MMQQVNLYPESLRPKKEWLTIVNGIWLAAAILFGVGTMVGWSYWEMHRLQVSIAGLQGEIATFSKKIEEYDGILASRSPDPLLLEEEKKLKKLVENKTKLLNQIDELPLGSTMGFARQIEALGEASLSGLWLTHIEIRKGGEAVSLQGKTTKAEFIPAYLKQLKQSEVFVGKGFQLFAVNKDKKQKNILNFRLQAEVEDESVYAELTQNSLR